MKCPFCGCNDAYVGMSVVECPNQACMKAIPLNLDDGRPGKGHPPMILRGPSTISMEFLKVQEEILADLDA